MRQPHARFTVRRMMIEVAIAAVLVAIHTPVLREVQRHEALKIDAQFQRQGAAVARENHMYALNTVSTSYGLAILDIVLAMAFWRKSRNFATTFLVGCFQFMRSEQRLNLASLRAKREPNALRVSQSAAIKKQPTRT